MWSVLGSYTWSQKSWPLGKESWYFTSGSLSQERRQKLQRSSTEDWLYFLFKSFFYRLGKRFQRVKYDSLWDRIFKIKSYLVITDELYFTGLRKIQEAIVSQFCYVNAMDEISELILSYLDVLKFIIFVFCNYIFLVNQVCNKQCDSLGDEVRVRIEGNSSDLHDAETNYIYILNIV